MAAMLPARLVGLPVQGTVRRLAGRGRRRTRGPRPRDVRGEAGGLSGVCPPGGAERLQARLGGVPIQGRVRLLAERLCRGRSPRGDARAGHGGDQRVKERQVQNEILRAFGTKRGMRLWRANVGVARIGNRVVHFGVPGQADLTGILPGGVRLEVEVKSADGTSDRRAAQLPADDRAVRRSLRPGAVGRGRCLCFESSRIRSGGNAVTRTVAAWIGKRIVKAMRGETR